MCLAAGLCWNALSLSRVGGFPVSGEVRAGDSLTWQRPGS